MSSNASSTERSTLLAAEAVSMTSPNRLTSLGTSVFLTPPSVEHRSTTSDLGSSNLPLPSGVQDLANVVVPVGPTEARMSNSHSYMMRPLEIVESIKGLHELHQQGGLTKEEFAQAKQQILDSGTSSASTYKSKSKRSRGRHHRRRGRRSRNSSQSTHDARSNTSIGADTKPVSHRSRRSSSSSSSSSSKSSSSSSSSSDRFIIVPRSNVWRPLNDRIEDGLLAQHSAEGHRAHGKCSDAPRLTHSPLLSSACAVVGVGDGEKGTQEAYCTSTRQRNGYQAIPSQDPLTSNRAGTTAASTSALATAPSTKDNFLASPSGSVARYAISTTVPDGPGKAKYGAFLHRDDGARAGVPAPHLHAVLNKEDVVCIQYFNSRGGSGNRFRDVELHTSQLRDPIFVHKGQTQVMPTKSRASTTKPGLDDTVMAMPTQGSQVFQLGEMTLKERRTWEERTTTHPSSSTSRRAKSSYFEQSFNWYWVDVTGRDASQQQYNATLRYLTDRFKLCESFLVDREHTLVLPQVCESPIYAGQYLLNLRVATDKIAISDDSVMELTNRWIIVVDLKQHIVITLHRVDTPSMANLRLQWKRVIENSNVSFQEFLLKIIDDAIYTYHLSLDVHTALLEKCEAKLFVGTPSVTTPEACGHYIDTRILHHFAGSSRSPFLRRLLDEQDRSPMNKGEMNSFLHHLHRRTSVQHRVINVTQAVLAKAFTKLRLCSREMAGQMCSSCIEVSDRAMEVRDDAKRLLNLHISLQSFRTTELMAVLTRVTMLFTPVTFLAGVYGMNFQKNFPELTWNYGYAFFWGMCVTLVIAMHLLFVREH
ncbi:cation transporter, putative [Leishmania tarentolae]|uniref:Cation transporter, putative n=1 Tax=Leishmania tarentolae TaxID=5689 RepID=A0A640KHS9_LEITA|nr:cation transporter, putative [Leishmania tarentolae]